MMGPKPIPVAERFPRFVPTGLGKDECWEWQGKRNRHGYGVISYRKTQAFRAHRVSWEIHNGRSIPPGKMVCHSCDNPPCVNPHHLWLGDHRANALDMVSKGRGKSPFKKLPPAFACRRCGHWRDDDVVQGKRRMCRQCINRKKREAYARSIEGKQYQRQRWLDPEFRSRTSAAMREGRRTNGSAKALLDKLGGDLSQARERNAA